MWCVQEKTADPGTARAAIVFANEYMHIDDVVLGANSLGLYQLVEMGETHNRHELARSDFRFGVCCSAKRTRH